MSTADILITAVNRLAKWRTVFAGWQLGTRPKGDPECDAVRDHREATIMLRVEVSALVALLQTKGVITDHEYALALITEARKLNDDYEKLFPGFKACNDGIIMTAQAAETAKGWRP